MYYHTIPYPETNENKIWTEDKIEPQQRYLLASKIERCLNEV